MSGKAWADPKEAAKLLKLLEEFQSQPYPLKERQAGELQLYAMDRELKALGVHEGTQEDILRQCAERDLVIFRFRGVVYIERKIPNATETKGICRLHPPRWNMLKGGWIVWAEYADGRPARPYEFE